jgi:hypothetical protein
VAVVGSAQAVPGLVDVRGDHRGAVRVVGAPDLERVGDVGQRRVGVGEGVPQVGDLRPQRRLGLRRQPQHLPRPAREA